MAQGAASYREDVERLRLRFMEFRKAHVARSRLPEELWRAAAKVARRDGIEATARVLDVDRPESTEVDRAVRAARKHSSARLQVSVGPARE